MTTKTNEKPNLTNVKNTTVILPKPGIKQTRNGEGHSMVKPHPPKKK